MYTKNTQVVGTDVEQEVWRGRPSQIVNTMPILFSVAVFFGLLLLSIYLLYEKNLIQLENIEYAQTAILSLPLVYLLYKYLAVIFERKIVTTKRIKIRKSIWNSGMRPVQLFRIKDHDYDEPWYWKAFGLGTVTLYTSDHSDTTVRIRAIKGAKALHDKIEKLVIQERKNQGVQEIDYKST